MVIIKNKNRKNAEAISIQTLTNLRIFLIQEMKKSWYTINEYNVYNEWDKKRRNEVKKAYGQLVKDEQTLLKVKFAQQVLNLGKESQNNIESIYPEIFKKGLLIDRRNLLLNIPQISKKDKSKKQVLSIRFIAKEIEKITKEIDKVQYKIDEFNKQIVLIPTDLGEDVADRLLDMVA